MGKKNRGDKKRGGGKGRSISKVKKLNIKHNKLAKKGKVKPAGSKPLFVEGGHLHERKLASAAKKKTLNKIEIENESERKREYEKQKKQMEEEALDEMADMIEPDDLQFLKEKASTRNSEYEMLSKVDINSKKNGLKNTSINENMLDEYELKALERQSAEDSFKLAQEEKDGKKRPLLPIRTKEGWQSRSAKAISNNFEEDDEMQNGSYESDDESDISSTESSTSKAILSQPISVIDIVAKRSLIIYKAKIPLTL